MKLRIPSYYEEFSCIADKCKDNCCIGWEIDIDEETIPITVRCQESLETALEKILQKIRMEPTTLF